MRKSKALRKNTMCFERAKSALLAMGKHALLKENRIQNMDAD